MKSYAIVIGADGYDPKIGKLDSAVRDALDFTTWVMRAGGVPAANLRLLLEPDPAVPPPALPPGVTGFSSVSARKIKEAIVGLRDALPAGGGERLYFYYAGHGASIPEWQEDPVLISPKFVDHDLDDDEVLGFKELFNRLGALTFNEQICLIDACRDFGLPGYEPVVLSGVRPRLAERKARQYVLYSVAPGQKAAESSRGGGIWTRALLDALEGRDYRAVIPGGTAQNPFEIRLDHLASRIRSEVENRTGRMDARQIQTPEYDRDRQGDNPLLAVFTEQTVPRAKLRVFVDPPLAHRTCQVSVMLYVPGRGELLEKASPPPPLRVPIGFELFPLSYSIRAEAEQFTVASRGWTVLDDPLVKLTLEKMQAVPLEEGTTRSAGVDDFLGEAAGATRGIPEEPPRGKPLSYGLPPEPAAADTGTLVLSSEDPLMRFEVLDDRRSVVHQAVGSFQLSGLQPGIYRLRISHPGTPPREETVDVRPGVEVPVTPSPPETRLGARVLDQLRQLQIGIAETEGRVEYLHPSEALGSIAGTRLASLLAFAAFAAQHPDSNYFHRLRAFGVRPLEVGPDTACGVLALVGAGADKSPDELERFLAGCRLTLRHPDGRPVDQGGLAPLPGLGVGAQRLVALSEAGTLYAELRMPGMARTRYVLPTLPGRLTVLVAVAEADGAMEVQQHLVPIPELSGVQDPVRGLWSLRRLDLAEAFAAAGDPDAALDVIQPDLEDLLQGRPSDPLLGCLAGYLLVQTGDTERFAQEALPHLLRSFPQFSDIQVLAGLYDPEEGRRGEHFENALRLGLPLFARGLRALAERFPDKPDLLAEPLASLVPGSLWSSWIPIQPVLLVRGGRFDAPPLSWSFLEQHRAEIEAALPAVGRIELDGHPYLSWVGTGFLVAPDLVMTASYVADQFLALPKLKVKRGVHARIDFREELGQTESPAEFDLQEAVAYDPELRIALLRVAPVSRDGALRLPAPLKLARNEPREPLAGRAVYAVGYPAYDARAERSALTSALRDVFNVKRLQPGEILEDPEGVTVRHDCFTTGGNGGSPLIDVASGAVLGLHHSGRKMAYKEAVALWRLADNKLFAGTGVEWVEW